jgi:sulfopyruvate decarboxylase subunit alpha
MSAEAAHKCLLEVGVGAVIALPDSKLAPLCRVVRDRAQIDYIQAVHESACVGIATGLSLSGVKTLVVIENSGLRSACETIARFHLSHNLFATYLIAHRGAFGERNWWGVAHHETMEPLLKLLRFRWEYLRSVAEFPRLLNLAYSTASAGQCSVALIAEPSFTEELLQ